MTEMRSVLDPRYDAAYEDRIRELEADYQHENEGRRAIEALYSREKARAEKAEADHEEDLRENSRILIELNACQARVAELKEALAAASPSGETPMQWGEQIALKAAREAAREAREREAD